MTRFGRRSNDAPVGPRYGSRAYHEGNRERTAGVDPVARATLPAIGNRAARRARQARERKRTKGRER